MSSRQGHSSVIRISSMSRRWVTGALAVTLASVMSACGSSEPNDRNVAGGTLVFASDAEPAGFNPRTPQGNTTAVGNIMVNVWPSVWRTTPDFAVELNSDLIVSAQQTSASPQTIVYVISPSAMWSDGTPITADDLIHTWEVLKAGATENGQPVQAVGNEGGISRMTASADGRTVTAVLDEPNAEWRAFFADPIVPAHVARRVGWNHGFDTFDAATVVSGGPFRIESYNPGRDLTLVRNETYWGKAASLDSIVFRFIRESSETVTALRNREVDVISPRVQVDLLQQLRDVDGVTTVTDFALNYEFLDLNLANPLLAVPEVRTALALSMDRQEIVQRTVGQVVPEAAVLNHRLFMKTQPQYQDTSGGRFGRPDPEGAKRLLEGVGFRLGGDGIYARDGKRLSVRITTTAGDQLRGTQEQLIQAQAKRAGIEVTIANTAELGKTIGSGDFDIINIGQSSGLTPSSTDVTFGTGGGANLGGYSDPRVDALYIQAKAELDDSKRVDILHAIDRLLWQNMFRLPLYQRPNAVAYRSDLVNIELNAAGGLFWNAADWERKAAG